MSKYWFKPKKYGYGTYPATWQGWVATFMLTVLIMIAFFIDIPIMEGSLGTWKNWLRYGLDVFILTTLFLVIFKDKTEGGLRWRWSDHKDKK